MKIRDFRMEDMPRLQEIFLQQGLPLECFPQLVLQVEKHGKPQLIANPRFVVRKVLEGDDGKIIQAALVKITSEPYFLSDTAASNPVARMTGFADLVEACAEEAKRKGLEDTTAWIPPHLEERFGPILKTVGFLPSPWASYTRKL